MAITNIADQLTPGRPTEITFAGETGLPSATNNLVLIGHLGAAAATGTVLYQPININNVASLSAASGEVAGYFGDGSELALMVIAAVKANQLGGNFPPITAIPLAIGDTDWGQALAALDRIPGSVIAGCYDGQTQQLLAQALISEAAAMSTAARVQNAQYGSVAVLANRSVVSGANLFAYDSQFGAFVWQRDTGTGAQANAQSIGELAASVGAQLAANQVPFNPLNNNILPNVPTPAKMADWITVGAGMESETALVQGWIPLRVLPNGTVAIVRARNLRTTVGDGVTKINSYYDVPDFQVLYFWRKNPTSPMSRLPPGLSRSSFRKSFA
jgi:phage tail sheath gpL-like